MPQKRLTKDQIENFFAGDALAAQAFERMSHDDRLRINEASMSFLPVSPDQTMRDILARNKAIHEFVGKSGTYTQREGGDILGRTVKKNMRGRLGAGVK